MFSIARLILSDGVFYSQFAPNNHYEFFFLHIIPSTIALRLEYVLFYPFYAEITTFFIQEMFGSVHI